jgi:hypothetical protein
MIRRPLMAFLVLCAIMGSAAAGNRFALVIGNDAGDRDEQELRYAELDADRLAATLGELGGFASDDIVTLRGRDADSVRSALIALNDRIRTSGGSDAMLVVYYSGHADADALHLGTSNLPLTQIEQLVRGSPAAFRLLIVDACRSGALTRVKGARAVAPVPVVLGDTLAADGVVFWTASAESEEAQESDSIKGSFFSHFLVSGLAGPADSDDDGAVTTTEAYDYARAATLRATSRTLAGTQHPTFRDELAGRSPVALTHPGQLGPKQARVVVPEERDVLVLAGSAQGPVIAEVGAHDKVRKLSLRAGTYFVRERMESHLLEGTIKVGAGDTLAVDDSQLSRVEYTRVAAKGAFGVPMMESRPDAIETGFVVRTPLVAGGDPCAGAIAGYAIALAWLTITPRVSACRESARNDVLTVTTDHVTADARVGHSWQLGAIALGAHVQLGGAVLHQHFDTMGLAPARTTAAAFFGAGGSLDVAVATHTRASLSTEVDSFVLQKQDGMRSQLSVAAILGVGVSL